MAFQFFEDGEDGKPVREWYLTFDFPESFTSKDRNKAKQRAKSRAKAAKGQFHVAVSRLTGHTRHHEEAVVIVEMKELGGKRMIWDCDMPLPPLTSVLSPALSAFVGAETMARRQVLDCIWDYIEKHNLQDPKNKYNIICDDKLKTIFAPPYTTISLRMQLSNHLFQHSGPALSQDASKEEEEGSDEEEEEKPRKKAKTVKAKVRRVEGGTSPGSSQSLQLQDELQRMREQLSRANQALESNRGKQQDLETQLMAAKAVAAEAQAERDDLKAARNDTGQVDELMSEDPSMPSPGAEGSVLPEQPASCSDRQTPPKPIQWFANLVFSEMKRPDTAEAKHNQEETEGAPGISISRIPSALALPGASVPAATGTDVRASGALALHVHHPRQGQEEAAQGGLAAPSSLLQQSYSDMPVQELYRQLREFKSAQEAQKAELDNKILAAQQIEPLVQQLEQEQAVLAAAQRMRDSEQEQLSGKRVSEGVINEELQVVRREICARQNKLSGPGLSNEQQLVQQKMLQKFQGCEGPLAAQLASAADEVQQATQRLHRAEADASRQDAALKARREQVGRQMELLPVSPQIGA